MMFLLSKNVIFLLAAIVSQPDEPNPVEVIEAAFKAEQAIAHGEIVFRYEGDALPLNAHRRRRGIETIPDSATLIFTFLGADRFRIVVSGDDGTNRIIVSDGTYIDTGNGERWDYQYLEKEWESGSRLKSDRFDDLMWPYFDFIRPHLFPLTRDFEMKRRPAAASNSGLTQIGKDESDNRTLTLSAGHGTRWEFSPEAGHRLVRWVTTFDSRPYPRHEWEDRIELSDGRTVMKTMTKYDNHFGSVGVTIDLSASDFDHVPNEFEFEIDERFAAKNVVWYPDNEFLNEIDYYAYFWLNVDLEPVLEPLYNPVVFRACLVLILLGVVSIAATLWYRRKDRKL